MREMPSILYMSIPTYDVNRDFHAQIRYQQPKLILWVLIYGPGHTKWIRKLLKEFAPIARVFSKTI